MRARTRRAPPWSRTACCRRCIIERPSRRGLISNIYKGRVSRVLPGMQAAFIEIGMERTAFLHASDIFDPRHAGTGHRGAAQREHPRSGGRGQRDPGAGRQGSAGHQGRAAHHLHHPAVAVSRLHAAGPRGRRLGADRGRERARAAAQRRAGRPRARTRLPASSCARPPRTRRAEALAGRHDVPAQALGVRASEGAAHERREIWCTPTCRCTCAILARSCCGPTSSGC